MQGTVWLYTIWKLYALWQIYSDGLRKAHCFLPLELAQLWRCPVMRCTMWKGTAQDCIDHMQRTHKVPLSVKVANLSKFFPAWTVTREQWAAMMIPSISGVAIDMLLFSRIGSPLCHRYRLICRTGSHAAFRGTYLRRLRAFLDESDSAAYRQSGECATSIYSRTPDCFSVMTTASPKWSFKFGRGAGVNLSASGKNVFHAGIDGSRAP